MAAIADDIAYNNHDLADGLRAGLFTLEDLRRLPLIGPCIAAVDARWPGLEPARREHEALRLFFGLLVEDVLATSRARIAAAGPGARIGDLSHAIGSVLSDAGYPINVEFGGHGIGSTMHQDPHVSNTGRPGRGYRLRPGLLLALEPWVMTDTDELVTDADGWTLRSATGCRTAHSEHTVAITEDGAEILTLP